MPGLSDFNPDIQTTQPVNSLADFKPDVAANPVNNVPSTQNLAAHSAMFSGDPQTAINNYQQINAEASTNGGSQTSQNIINSIQADNMQKAQNVLPAILQDDTLSDKQKSDAINNVFDKSSPMYKPSNILTAEAVTSPVKAETHEQESLRVNLGTMIDDMNSRKAAQQKVMNATLAQQNPQVSASLFNFMNTLVPGWGLSQMFPKTTAAIQSMVPGITEKTGAEVGYAMSKAQGGSTLENLGAGIKGAFTTGAQQQVNLREAINNADPKDQMALTQHIADAINASTSGNLLLAPQDFAKADYLQKTLSDGFISDKDKWASTIMNVVDLFGGAVTGVVEARGAVKAIGAAGKAGKATEGVVGASRAMPPELPPVQGSLFDPPNLATSEVQPTSVAMNIKDVNADKFRSIHDVVANSTSDDIAQAFYGTNREQAVRNDLFPEVARDSGAVTARVSNPDIQEVLASQVDPSLKNYVDADGAIWATDKEKLSKAALVTNDFDSSFQINNRKEMAQIQSLDNDLNGNTVRIKATYGPAESGFSDPGQALDAVQFGLRDYGVRPEDMTLLRRVGGDYVPMGPTTQVTRADPGFIKATADSDIEQALNKGNYAKTQVGGEELRLVGADHGGDVREVVAFDKDGNKVGSVLYGQGGERIDNPNVKVSPEWQKKGVANAMYDYAEKHGATFPAPDTQTFSRSAAGQAFRDARAKPDRVKASFTGPTDTYATTSLNEVNDFKTSMLSENINEARNPADYKDFLVQVNHDYKLNPFDMDYSDKVVKNNGLMDWFSSLRGTSGKGSLQRHLVTPHSMFDPAMTLGRSKGINKAAGIEHQLVILGQEVASRFNKLPKERQAIVWDMMKEQNAGSFKFDRTTMIGRGLSEAEMDTMDHWSKFWDNSWFFENRDNTKSLINRGFMRYADEANDIELHARPVKQSSIANGIDAYDPLTDEIRHVSKAELDAHYKSGGTAAELANPITIGGESAEHILSKETVGEGYLRALNPDDRTLNYRPGYYHVEYKDPHIIVQKRILDNGKELHTPVATAANTRDAEIMGKRLSAQDGLEYYNRPNSKTQLGRDVIANQLNVSRGRSPQRVRGVRLANATADISNPAHSHIKSPAEALIDSSRSLSKRLGTRDSQDAIGRGMLQQYGEKYFPKDKAGNPQIPGSVSEINYKGDGSYNPKELAAARSTFEYYNQFNNAYINSIDDTYKGLLNSTARLVSSITKDSKSATISKVGGKVEGALLNETQGAGPAGKLRNLANTFYIVTNPVKQLLVQGAQVMQMAAINPAFWTSKEAYPQMMYLISRQFGSKLEPWMSKLMGMTDDAAEEMWTHFQMSGNVAAIDKHTMIVGGLKDFADSLKGSNGINKFVGRPIGATLNFVRKIGFDAGENLSQVGAWLTYRDKALRAGETMADMATRDKVAALATNATGNMNGSAIQPFEQNDLNLIFQFMGWQQRWASNLMGNRVINTFDKGVISTKNNLRGMQVLMYGVPGGYVGSYYLNKAGILPSDPKLRDSVVDGLSGMFLNKLSSVISHATGGGDVSADWSSLSPFDLYGVADHFHQLMTGDAGQILSTAPAATLFYGNNGKLTKAARTVAQYTHLMRDDDETPATFKQVATDFANAFPAFSNTFKAIYSFESGKKLSAVTGKVTDQNVQPVQAVLYAFGINGNDEKKANFVNQLATNDYKELKSDIQYWHDRQREILLRNDITPDELQYALRMQSECWRVFNNFGQTARQECNRLIQRDVLDGNVGTLKQAMRITDMESKKSASAMADMYPDTDKDKADKLRALIDYLGTDTKEENK